MKLIGIVQCDGSKIEVSVQLILFFDYYLFFVVYNEYNVVYVYGEVVGEMMFYGSGVGSMFIVIFVVFDFVVVMKNMCFGVNGNSFVVL